MDDAGVTFEIGAKVVVDWHGEGQFYPAAIKKANDDGTFLVHYDDGSVEDNVYATRIQSKMVTFTLAVPRLIIVVISSGIQSW